MGHHLMNMEKTIKGGGGSLRNTPLTYIQHPDWCIWDNDNDH